MKEATTFSSHIAVLDDDLRFIRMVERGLAHAGVGVTPVTTLDPDEAVAVIAASDCAAALIDVYMYGDAAGFDIIRRLRSQPSTNTLPLILTTAARREVGRHATFLRANACDVLLKPFAIDDLVRAVQDARESVCARAAAPAALVPAPVTLSA